MSADESNSIPAELGNDRLEDMQELSGQEAPEAQFKIAHLEYSGALPHPTIVEGYERLSPGSADRILAMVERREKHSLELESARHHNQVQMDLAVIRGFIWNERLGMFLVVGLALAIVLIGMRIMELGHSAEGFALIVGAACGIGIAYVKSFGHSRNQDGEPNSS